EVFQVAAEVLPTTAVLDHLAAPNGDGPVGGELGRVLPDPAGRLARGGHWCDAVVGQTERVDGCVPGAAVGRVAEAPDDDDAVAGERGGVEVGRREHVARVAVDLGPAVRPEHDHVVVDVEVGVVKVLVLSADADEPAVGQSGAGHAHAVEGPDR